jgi:long-chain acyl-CoA synthetase
MHSSVAAIGHLAVGATLVLQERFHPEEAAEAIARYGVSVIIWVPTMYIMTLELAQSRVLDLSSLRVCVSGGASLPWSVAVQFEQKFGKWVLSAWGMTEGTPVTGFAIDRRGRPDSIGTALPGCEVRVIRSDGGAAATGETGELIYSSPSNMLGYLNKPEESVATLRDGWVWSGDLGWLDDQGYFYIAGRSKDLIIRGGAKIYPPEIEGVLCARDDIVESAVVGVPDGRFGEAVYAFVRLGPGRQPEPQELSEYCRKLLAGYKVPQRFIFVDDFPRGSTGKLLKRVLRQQVQHEPSKI